MARRVLIIYRVDEAVKSNQGVVKKLEGQAKGFEENGWDTDTIRISEGQIILNQKPIKQLSKSKFASVLFEFFQSIKSSVDFKDYGLLYVRYGLSFTGFISFLKEAKQQNPEIKILLEFATYPYTEEWTGAKGLVVRKVDGHYRNKLKKYVDHVVHLGKEKSILGMPCINSENGIDVDKIKLRRLNAHADLVNLIAVGKWQFWHGLDRLINGLAIVKDINRKLRLTIIGNGPAIESLKSLVEEKSLQNVVEFKGEQIGEDLNLHFDNADIGIGTLGMHRKHIEIDSSLKHREYASRGLPFILCTQDNDFPDDTSFVQYFPENEDVIDMQKLLEFSKQARQIKPTEIRAYAEDQLSWSSKISTILAQIYGQ